MGATAYALFTKNQRQWSAPSLTKQSIALFNERNTQYGFSPDYILPHGSYLINPGHPDHQALEKSRLALLLEMQRCEQLGLKMLNFHPGGHLNLISIEQCLQNVSDSINYVLERTNGVTAVIENTAGQGTNVGYQFDHLSTIIKKVNDKRRVGVCIDTCHAFTSGYNLADALNYEAVWEEFDNKVGFSFLKAIHLNDSKKSMGSYVDRHESINKGFLGPLFFERIMKDVRFNLIPFILETPNPILWEQEIKWLRQISM